MRRLAKRSGSPMIGPPASFTTSAIMAKSLTATWAQAPSSAFREGSIGYGPMAACNTRLRCVDTSTERSINCTRSLGVALSMKRGEQCPRLSQVACVKALREPIVDGGEEVTCRLQFALIAQKPRHAHGSTQFPGFCLLRSRNYQGALEIRLRFRDVPLWRFERDFAGNAITLRLAPPFLG